MRHLGLIYIPAMISVMVWRPPRQMSNNLPEKIQEQILKAGLPTEGAFPFVPLLGINRRGEAIIQKFQVPSGPKKGKLGYADVQGRIWIKDYAHGDYPDHWDVQETGQQEGYTRVDFRGNVLE